jgi:hypothetical protein
VVGYVGIYIFLHVDFIGVTGANYIGNLAGMTSSSEGHLY